MRQVMAAAIFGAALGPLLALSWAQGEAFPAALRDALNVICFGQANASATHNDRTPGLYMPMFSTPPKGGIEYNGPPLDEC